jgi:succinyl-diaminopimelate desuccinylase
MSARDRFRARVGDSHAALTELTSRLVRVASPNPPGDTEALVVEIESVFARVDGAQCRRVTPKAAIENLIVKLHGAKPGRRLIMNAHLDTFPVGAAGSWTVEPFGGLVRDGRLYGRGSADMKAGLAASIMTAILLADCREAWRGELVLALVGDEETGGRWGTQYLLAHDPDGRGDAVLSADAGAPSVVRFGEKGQIWLEVSAAGRSSHGAHVHLGENAIERLMAALTRLTQLRTMNCPIPPDIRSAVLAAAERSEAVSGRGETKTLLSLTVNVGTIEGGVAVNIVPDSARARLDLRFPPGLSVAAIVEAARACVADLPGINVEVLSSTEANWTEPGSELVQTVVRNAAAALGSAPVANMRPGFSDARFYRLAGIPAVVYGPTPHNMGGPDEHVTLDDLRAVFEVQAMSAYDYLTRA